MEKLQNEMVSKQPLFFSTDNGQCSCENHIPYWGHRLQGTWYPAEEYSYTVNDEPNAEVRYYECELCRQESRIACEMIWNAKK